MKLVSENAEPSQVLLRIYGQTHGERAFESIITESVIFTLLSERKLGPKLHGIFPGGRLEEYIPARPLKTKELQDKKLSLLIADKMALVHQMNIPISKEPRWLWDTMNRLVAAIKTPPSPFYYKRGTYFDQHDRNLLVLLAISHNLTVQFKTTGFSSFRNDFLGLFL